ncbi:uncharacterized protein [Medicago truncatula]|uniref:Uncharacterized protein n=1 Tax=Medicago truncatula TaxID=3880 RepID=Q2HRH5_MEDTR|nr:uncharacterized protein LOC11418117 [Medicago truncatula]ABD33298.1 hypothetical protein MtrDRAFT_AC158502g7v2 [Medicago truncatula]AES81283.1 hypothetical protein MTR_7g090560 [Medicago truncatula]AFK39006.1 unknown [Medicago truncatula]
MAGLQQYNFFPTDLFYPRPQPEQSTTSPTVLPLKTPNGEDLPQTQQKQPARSMIKVNPSTSSLVYTHKTQSFGVVDNNMSKFSLDPLSLMVWMDQEDQE